MTSLLESVSTNSAGIVNKRFKRPFHRVGDWLPDVHSITHDWLDKLIKEVDQKKEQCGGIKFDDSINEFRGLIEGDPTLRMLASLMFDEIPVRPPYDTDPIGNKQVRNYEHMLELFNEMLGKAPKWNTVGYNVGLVGFPFNVILDWPMRTANGYAFFLNSDVNKQLKKILKVWTAFLQSPASRDVLVNDEDSWFGGKAIKALVDDGNVGNQTYSFEQIYKCDPSKEFYGFGSWDEFFTREFNPGLRPVAYENKDNPLGIDPTSVIVNACESKPYALQSNIRKRDKFWLKGQPYSLRDILAYDVTKHPEADHFEGGTIYQAFLSPTTYHRWHAPVSGTVVKTRIIEGTYFSEPTFAGFQNPNGPDLAGPDRSQGYITSLATRAVVYIQAKGKVGLLAFVAVGMSEVSSCEIFKKENETVEKGEQLGCFHHGGSTHCLVFQPDVDLAWSQKSVPENEQKENQPVNSALAYVVN